MEEKKLRNQREKDDERRRAQEMNDYLQKEAEDTRVVH